MIEAKNLEIGHDKTLVNVNLDIKAGSLTVLLGRNGAGKSTLLKTIAGLIPSLNGSLSYEFDDLTYDLSVVLSKDIDVSYFKLIDMVSLGRHPYSDFWGGLKERDHLIVSKIIKEMDLDAYKNQYFNNLSDGLKQKCLIAKALAKEPKVLLLDEPFVYLDPPAKLSLVKILKELAELQSITIVVATHDWEIVSSYFSDIYAIGKQDDFFKTSVNDIIDNNRLTDIFDLPFGIIQEKDKFIIKNS